MIDKRTLQKQIGFWQSEQPSIQSVRHGQAEYQGKAWWNYLYMVSVHGYRYMVSDKDSLIRGPCPTGPAGLVPESLLTVCASNGFAVAVNETIVTTTTCNALYVLVIAFWCTYQTQIVITKYVFKSSIALITSVEGKSRRYLRTVGIDIGRLRCLGQIQNRKKYDCYSHAL